MSGIDQPQNQDQPGVGPGQVPPTVEPPGLPEDLLDRHRARVLRPAEAVPAAHGEQVHSTAYRYEFLLVPYRLLGDREFRAFFRRTLDEINVRPVVDIEGWPAALVELDVAPPVRLEHADEPPDAPVDAWRVLQRLRFRARGTGHEKAVEQISLDHLLRGCRLDMTDPILKGAPGTEGHHGGDSPYLNPDFCGRMPVSVLVSPPARPAVSTRRVVVAVIDTGVGPHPWLPTGGADPFADVTSYLRPISAVVPPDPAAAANPEGTGRLQEPLIGDLDSDAGHGTFLAGIVRQVAPYSRVLSVPIMHSDGVMHESDLRLVLGLLVIQVQNAAAPGGNKERFVDVLCMAFGAYHEFQPTPQGGTVPDLLNRLSALGTTVVASAGNDATSREMYPAALPNVEAVGALNPNGSRAVFSNEAGWVDWWALGAAVVSTLPTTFQGSQTPHLDNQQPPLVNGLGRQSLDPDDFRRGFGVWSGTSFAAASFAARVAAEIHTIGTAQYSAHPLDQIQVAVARARRDAALQELRQEGAADPPERVVVVENPRPAP